MKRGFRRRRATLYALRGIRLLRRHYATLLSATVIAALGVIAVRSDAFPSSGRPAEPRFILDVGREPPPPPEVIQSFVWSPPTAELGLRSIVYFIYETEADREAIEAGLGDLARQRFKLDVGGPEDTNFFVRAATPDETAAALEEVARAEELARLQGYSFQVVDLRAIWQ